MIFWTNSIKKHSNQTSWFFKVTTQYIFDRHELNEGYTDKVKIIE